MTLPVAWHEVIFCSVIQPSRSSLTESIAAIRPNASLPVGWNSLCRPSFRIFAIQAAATSLLVCSDSVKQWRLGSQEQMAEVRLTLKHDPGLSNLVSCEPATQTAVIGLVDKPV